MFVSSVCLRRQTMKRSKLFVWNGTIFGCITKYKPLNCVFFVECVHSSAQVDVSQRIQNVTSIINVISKVIVVDACNETERFKPKKVNTEHYTAKSCAHGIFHMK